MASSGLEGTDGGPAGLTPGRLLLNHSLEFKYKVQHDMGSKSLTKDFSSKGRQIED